MKMALSADYIVVKMDDIQFANGDIVSVDLGLWYDQQDVTGFGSAIHEVLNGLMRAPVTIRGYLTTTTSVGTHTVIQSAYAAGSQVSLEVQVGQNAPPQANDPMFTGEFLIASYKPVITMGGAVMFEAQLLPAVGSGDDAPQWKTIQ
jgi:hypothetical protein